MFSSYYISFLNSIFLVMDLFKVNKYFKLIVKVLKMLIGDSEIYIFIKCFIVLFLWFMFFEKGNCREGLV